MKIIKQIVSFFIFLGVIYCNIVNANSYTITSVPNPYNQVNVTYVVDPDNILTKSDADIINERLKLLETRTTIETAVVALPSIGNEDTRQFANELFNHWNIGKKEKDNGLLILLVLDQREVVFEVGYGLEGNLTDAKSYRLMDQYMLPQFRQNQFSEGMRVGVDGVAGYLEQQFYDGTLYSIGSNPISFSITFYIIIIILILLVICAFWGDRIFVIKNWYNARYNAPLERLLLLLYTISLVLIPVLGILGIIVIWISFDHFMFLLIALFVNLAIILLLSIFCEIFSLLGTQSHLPADKKLICPRCRHRSVIELNTDKKTFLTDNEQYQLKIGSVSYRLFSCEREKCRSEFKGNKINDNWKVCPKCQLVTCQFVETITSIESTEDKEGQIIKIYTCVKCQHKIEEKVVTPSNRQTRYNNGRSSNGRSGGGFGGRSSGGSRGGGRSGGGGARGRF